MKSLYIGLMSGTSLDGVDALLADFDPPGMRVLDHVHRPLPPSLRDELLALNLAGANELHRAALAANALSRVYASTVDALLQTTQHSRAEIVALGAHGQTVRHRPAEFDGTGYTLQLLNAALLAELTKIDVICDFRTRDLAAGGQGAPLVPGFHHAIFNQPGLPQAILNIGGISNITLLDGRGGITGFDCGPGNALMDLWIQHHLNRPFDNNGLWAASGQIQPDLLQQFLSEPFLAQSPPKSTGRDLFNEPWLKRAIHATHKTSAPLSAEAVQATLLELTAEAAAQAVRSLDPPAQRLMVCGGGALNGQLMARIQALLPCLLVSSTDTAGLPPMQVEAAAFAWLAHQFNVRQGANLPAVTGARGPRILGALYPAG